jgi:hypothetical protein
MPKASARGRQAVKLESSPLPNPPDSGPVGFAFHGSIPIPRSIKCDFVDLKDVERKVLDPHPSLLVRRSALNMAFAGFTPLPPMLKARMKYVSPVTLSSGVTPGVNVFSANGLYDPDITGTGHQPRGFDQLIALYDHYVVVASHITVHFGASSQVFPIIGIQLQSSSTAQSDYVDYAEQPRCVFDIGSYVLGPGGGFPDVKSHTLHFKAPEFMGIPDPITSTKLQGSVNANPSDQAYFHVWSQHQDGSSSNTVTALVFIEYDVVFIEPVPVASS